MAHRASPAQGTRIRIKNDGRSAPYSTLSVEYRAFYVIMTEPSLHMKSKKTAGELAETLTVLKRWLRLTTTASSGIADRWGES